MFYRRFALKKSLLLLPMLEPITSLTTVSITDHEGERSDFFGETFLNAEKLTP